MLLAPFVLHAQFVIGGRADDVAGVVCLRHVVRMSGVMQRMGDVGPVRIPFMERHRHFCTLYQREVNTVGVAAIGFGKAYWHTFVALLFIITIRIKLNPIKPALIQMSIFIILFRA